MSNLSAFGLAPAYDLLTGFAHQDDFWGLFETAFGTQYDRGVAEGFRSQWQVGDFGDFPKVEVVSQQVLGTANGAYATSTNTIYLSDRFLASATAGDLTAVVLEEFGHFVDAQVNQVDTQGDEGELFSDLVRGVELSPSELTRIQTEDDHAVVRIGGQPIAIEMALITNNDTFANGTVLIGQNITTTGSNIGFTGETGESIQSGTINSAWWSWTATTSTPVTIDTIGSNFDTYLSVFTGNAINALTFVASNDDSGDSVTSKVSFTPTPGTTYQIAVDGYNSDTGNIVLNLNQSKTGYIQFGTSYQDLGYGISIDSSSNVYVTGLTNGSLLGGVNLGYSDAFIAKYDASGNQLWVKQFGSSGYDFTFGISTDSNGNVYAPGFTYGSLPGNSNLGSYDAFVAKYDASGNQLWVKQFGSSDGDYALGISTDSSGNIYVSGDTSGSLPGNSNLGGYIDAFVAKYDASGNQLWVKQFGSSDEDSANGISTNSSGNIYVTGMTTGSLPGYSNLGSKDAFITKYDASGNQLWVKQFGSSGDDSANGISIDSSGNVYVTGDTGGSLPGNSNLGGNDAFVAKYDASGNQLWVKQFGTSGEDSASGISTDSSGNIYVTGDTDGNLPGNSNLGSNDAFVAKYDASGNQLWVKQFGTSGDDIATGISTNSNGNVYVTGWTGGSLPGNSNLGSYDAFVVGFDANGNLLNTSNRIIESNGNTQLVKNTANNLYIQTNNQTPIAIKYANQLITDNTYPGWQPIAAENINGQNQVLWKNVSQNLIIIWKLDNNGNYQSSDQWNINSSQALAQETTFQIDLNGDGKLGNSYSNIESQGNQKLIKDTLGTIYSQTNEQTPIAIKYANQLITNNTYSGWQPIAAENINGQNQVLWKNASQNLIIIWKLDNNGNYQSSDQWNINSSQALAQETTFQIDLNGDGKLGNSYSNLESQGNQKLIKDTLGTIYSQTNEQTPIAIKYANQLITNNTYSGWQPIAAETINGQNQVLWKNASQNLIIIWKLDNNGNYQSSDQWNINSSQALAQETTFQIDLNGDGKLGNSYSNLESQGNQKLIKDSLGTIYSQTNEQIPIAIKYANQLITNNTYSGWQPIAAENINGQNQVLWKNASQNLIIIWKLDNNGSYQSSDQWNINSSQALAQETTFQIDLNGDGKLGNSYSNLESQGNQKLIKDSLGTIYSQTNEQIPIAIKYANQSIAENTYPGWQAIAAENINGQNQVLWKNVSQNLIIIWKLDNNGNYQSADQWNLNSSQSLAQETIFGVDTNGDGTIGNPAILNLVGTSSNDILVGGARNDILTGAGGKDTLTGGGGSDRFDYKNLSDSLLTNFDVITDFNANPGNDLLLVTTARSGFTNAGAIATLDTTGINAQLTAANFAANSAAQFTVGTRTFVAINDAIAGFNATTDALIEVTGLTGTLSLNNFVTI